MTCYARKYLHSCYLHANDTIKMLPVTLSAQTLPNRKFIETYLEMQHDQKRSLITDHRELIFLAKLMHNGCIPHSDFCIILLHQTNNELII